MVCLVPSSPISPPETHMVTGEGWTDQHLRCSLPSVPSSNSRELWAQETFLKHTFQLYAAICLESSCSSSKVEFRHAFWAALCAQQSEVIFLFHRFCCLLFLNVISFLELAWKPADRLLKKACNVPFQHAYFLHPHQCSHAGALTVFIRRDHLSLECH